ncbi:PEP-CTERM sorting domain-containing protein [Nostoc sp. 'Peltigera membranacea cyanobiont' 213]|uniref:PEP-CTERM sorting domain-containing protein n=1 Tax=Nostoc sp. 'Peltigera membranacea cyanobiont' 213 TaxID=2014530 RepID=UPI001181387C|nr:PEP-CTERM sorting domain-containing protein [Nostoc sp. 'Peltigera membranacea cyanobiont' 213]
MLRLKSICVLMLATSALSLISYPVKAALINFNSQGNITAIKGLQIKDNSYNVEFVQDTFSNLFGNPSNLTLLPTFWLDAEGAKASINAIDRILETTYPSVIASDKTQGTTDYIIPQQSASPRVATIDEQGNITYLPTNLFGGLWGNYSNYYQDRQRDELYNTLCQINVYCSVNIYRMINPEIFAGTDINSPRTFAIFSPNANKLIPEPSNIVGLGIMGILTLLISKKIRYKFI